MFTKKFTKILKYIFSEFEELKSYLPQYKVLKYVPSEYVMNKFKDGGIAIIDQITIKR